MRSPEKRGSRNVTTAPEIPRSDADSITVEDDPRNRFRLYVLCECPECGGDGKVQHEIGGKITRCQLCRGEGRVLNRLAEMETAEALGVAIETLGEEGDLDDCPIGVWKEGHWLVRPWLASPRNVSDAGKLLRSVDRK